MKAVPEGSRLLCAGRATVTIGEEHGRIEVATIGHDAVPDDVLEIHVTEPSGLLGRVRDGLVRTVGGGWAVAIGARGTSLRLVTAPRIHGGLTAPFETSIRRATIPAARRPAVARAESDDVDRHAVVVTRVSNTPVVLGVLRELDDGGSAYSVALVCNDGELARVVADALECNEDAWQ